MSDVSQLTARIDSDGAAATDQLLPLVYDDLRRLAAQHLAQERQCASLQATVLVHEAYLRLVRSNPTGRAPRWENPRHFFAAAAEAMRRILVEHARKKQRLKRGGHYRRRDLAQVEILAPIPSDDVIAVHEALDRLEAVDSQAAQLVKLRYFAGFTIPEAAPLLDISPRKVNQLWAYARAWMLAEMGNATADRIQVLPQ
jgi:RNA polymerase sigma factor (TIGR02999 family)